MSTLRNVFKIPELRNKLLFTLLMIALYRFGAHVPVPGIDLTVLRLSVEETFFRMLRYREFDAAEMSLSAYVLSLAEPVPPFVALPVFPSRLFRHSAVYVAAGAGITAPADLAGRRVGVEPGGHGV